MIKNYRVVRDPSSGQYYIHFRTMFPRIQLLLAYYKTTPINEELNILLLHPVARPDQQQKIIPLQEYEGVDDGFEDHCISMCLV